MKKTKIFLLICFSLMFVSTTFAQIGGTEFPYSSGESKGTTTDFGQVLKEDVKDNNKSALNQLIDAFQISNYRDSGGKESAFAYVRFLVNFFLGVASTLAVVMLIYDFFMIMIGKSEEGITKAKKSLSGVIMALLFLGSAWLIVTFIFYIYTKLV